MESLMKILQLIPMITETVKAVEAVLPMSGQGKAKADMAMQILEAGGVGVATMAPMVQSLISVVVTGLNAAGVFAKSPTPATPAA